MPRYRDPSTGKTIQSSEPLTDAELEEAFGGGGPSFDLRKAGDYVERKAGQFVNAAQNLYGDVQQAFTDRPMIPGGPRSAGDIAMDALTVGGPVAAPGLTALGTGVGAISSGLGADEDTADIANAGTQLAGGLVQAGRAAGGLRGAIGRRFAGVSERMAQRGTTLSAASPEGQKVFGDLWRAQGRFTTRGTAEFREAGNVMRQLTQGRGMTYGELDDALTRVQGIRQDSRIAGIIRSARDALTAGTPEAGELRGAYRASRLARMSLPSAARTAIGTGGLAGAGIEAYRGNYGRAAAALALGATGAGASVGHLLAAAGPLARAGASAGSVVAGGGEGKGGIGGDQPAPAGSGNEPDDMAPSEVGMGSANPTAPNDVAVEKPARRYAPQIEAAAALAKIPPRLLHLDMMKESSGNPKAVGSDAPSYGLMQILPGTFETVRSQVEAAMGREASVHNPLDNLLAGAFLWRKYLDKSGGDLGMAARMYQGGENPRYWGPHNDTYAADVLRRWQTAER